MLYYHSRINKHAIKSQKTRTAKFSAQRLDPVRWSRLRREPSVEELSQGRLGGAGVKDPPADAGDGFDP